MSRTIAALAAAAALSTLVGCAPKPAFTVNTTSGNAPLTVQFTDASQSLFLGLDIGAIFPVVGWTWDFGDLSTGTEQNPAHEYKEGGLYTVSLTARNFFGTATETKAQLIRVTKDDPEARFTATVSATDVRTFNFADTSLAGSGTVGSRQWDFGDGVFATGSTLAHTYALPGSYTVVLEVCTNVGCDTETKTLVVPGFTPPTAVIRVSSTANNRQYRFEDRSAPGNIPLTGRNWDFGDGGRSAESPATHTFPADGVYTVTLEACGGALCDTAQLVVGVGVSGPTADFNVRTLGDPAAFTVEFTDISTPGDQPITSREWDFGDNTFDTAGPTVTHTYPAAGVYSVRLRVCAGALCNEITRPLTLGSAAAARLGAPE